MAFPTSSLTNNQVHKEGNRAFVYDSALGVWDQVRETDRTENKILSGSIGGSALDLKGGTIRGGVSFPAGHVIKTATDYWQPSSSWSPGTASVTPLSISFTPERPNSKIQLFAYFGMVNQTTTQSARTLFNFYKDGALLSPGTSSYGVAYIGENTTSISWYRAMTMFLEVASWSPAATIDVRIDGSSTRKMHANGNNWLTIQEISQ